MGGGTTSPGHERPKPRLRGRLHEVAFFVSIPAGLVLVLSASGSREVVAAAIYWLALSSQFGVSAAYHLGMWSEVGRERMRTLDHATIFVLIAGTYTPFCLLVLHGAAAIVVLVIVWTGAAVGIAMKVYRVDLHVLSGFLYLGLGWVAVIVFPPLVRELSTTELALMVAGGLLYSAGALVLALHRPNPWPRTFGYHEVWHAATIGAAACLYTAILSIFLSS
jgi:hemolysin III